MMFLCSKLLGELKKFPFKGLFPFDGFPFNEYELYMVVTTKKYHYIFLWHYFGSKWSPVHYFDDRPMPLMVI